MFLSHGYSLQLLTPSCKYSPVSHSRSSSRVPLIGVLLSIFKFQTRICLKTQFGGFYTTKTHSGLLKSSCPSPDKCPAVIGSPDLDSVAGLARF